MRFLSKYERENKVEIVDWQQVGPRLIDACIRTGGFFSELK